MAFRMDAFSAGKALHESVAASYPQRDVNGTDVMMNLNVAV